MGQPLLCLVWPWNWIGQTAQGQISEIGESFFVNGVEIDAHENKNTISANLSPFIADLVDSGVWASTRQKTPQLIMPV